MKNILLTGGRAPATLELARMFHSAGWQVFTAESVRWHLTGFSRVIQKNYLVPSPKQSPDKYIQALQQIIQQENIDLLIPTCEEIFYIAKGLGHLSPHCTVFVETVDRLRPLHDKWLFSQRAGQYGLSVPETNRVISRADLLDSLQANSDVVLKPAYSRFATDAIIRPQPDKLPLINISPACPWVVQEFITGQQICTYSVAHNGHITAHATYRTEFTVGQGATIVFQAIDHPTSWAWVEQFVHREQFTGQIAFDFIETESNELFAIECNPRTTNGILLFRNHPDIISAFIDHAQPCLKPPDEQSVMISLGMLLFVLPSQVKSWPALRRWLEVFSTSRGVVFNYQDPLPALLQIISLGQFFLRSVQHKVDLRKASTLDIEWNGE